MSIQNVEIKARASNQEFIRQILRERDADFKGIDHQIDTYFRVSSGRLKLREGNIENNLIHYHRKDTGGPKGSEIMLYPCESDSSALKKILTNAMGVLVVVDKKREIYFIDNVKFHIDSVTSLGSFVEIEAIDMGESIGNERLQKQCEYYISLFNISDADMVASSYSDLLMPGPSGSSDP